MSNPLVSIIIPTFNRTSLLPETLDSIIAQDYEMWECLLIDDGSTENNLDILHKYSVLDNRFIVLERKKFNKPKGANACRNIGLEQAKGDFIIFFDSDDLMTQNHLSTKVKLIQSADYDFAVTRTQYFNEPDNPVPINYRGLDSLPINGPNYITKKINWLTFDVIIKKNIAQQINFNENLQANQEYNYFSKLTTLTDKATQEDHIVSLKRFDPKSIQGNLSTNQKSAHEKAFQSYWHTYLDLEGKLDRKTASYLINQCLEAQYRNPEIHFNKIQFFNAMRKTKGLLKAIYYARKF